MKHKDKIAFCIFVMWFTFGPGVGHSLADEETTGVYHLGEVVVSARGEAAEAIETEKTVTAMEIKERNARTLDEALELLPGVNIRTGADGIPRIDIRGFRTRHVLLLLNGTPFNSAFDGQFDPSAISVESIAEIRLITGGASILYGPGGNGGVINIITKKGKPGIHGSVEGEGAEGNSYLTKGTLSGGVGDVDAFVGGSTFGRDKYYLSNSFAPTKDQSGGPRVNSDFQRDNVFANVGWSPSEKSSCGLTYSFIDGSHGVPPVVNFSRNDPFSNGLKFDRVNSSQNNAVQFAGSQELSGPFSIRGWAYYNQLDMVENLYDDATYTTQNQKGSSSTDSTTRIGGANVQLRGDFKKFGVVTLSLMPESDSWKADGFQEVQVGQKKKQIISQIFDTSHDFQIYSTLFQYEVSPIDHMGLVFGLGSHWQDRDGDSKQDYSYLVGAYYDLFEGTRLKANHARKIKYPTLRDLYDTNSGNPGLDTETTLHYEAGIEQDLPAKTKLSLTGFVIDAHNFIEKDTNNISQNFDKYRFKGFEISAENRFFERLMVRASYSLLDSENKSPGIHSDELQFRPRDKVACEGNYRFPWGMSINASMQYVANQVTLDNNNLNTKSMPDFTIVDVKLNQSLLNKALDIYVGFRNLLDENYAENYGFPQPGRTFYGGVAYRF